MMNVSVPNATVPLNPPFISYLESGCIAWRGSTLAGAYSVEVSTDDEEWVTICDKCWNDSNGPWWD